MCGGGVKNETKIVLNFSKENYLMNLQKLYYWFRTVSVYLFVKAGRDGRLLQT